MAVSQNHAGLTGTLNRGDNRLVGQVLTVDGVWGGEMFSFQINDAQGTNKFYKRDWEFVPDPTRIPEATGLYAKMVDGEPVLFFRLVSPNDPYPSFMVPNSGDGWQGGVRSTLKDKLGDDGEISEIEVSN